MSDWIIRQAEARDWPAIWPVIRPVFRAGETYAVDPAIDEAGARAFWLENPAACFVAVNAANEVLGSYYIKANHPGPGEHVCNCGYIVAESARGQGIASAMCRHSLAQAAERGFEAMQYNLVVASNHAAIRLWQRYGFEIVGTLPGAFRHPDGECEDAHVMYRHL